MRLYLVRHAEAVPLGGSVSHDRDRFLTPDGRTDAGLVGRFLGMNESSVGLLLTSPLARAVETGELIRSGLPVSPPARTTENLSPGFRQKALLDEIVSSNAEAVIAVGHQPDMSGFLMWLITDARGLVEMPPCTTALVQLGPANAPDSAALRWLITPDLLRRQYPNDIRRSS